MVDGINSQPVNNSLILNVYNLWSKTVIDFSRFRLIWFDQGLPTTIDYSVQYPIQYPDVFPSGIRISRFMV